MNNAVEKVLALLDDFRTSDEITYSAYSALHDEISLLDDLLKEQEPVLVEHKKVNDDYQAIEDEFVCKHCGAWWMIPEEDLKYCPGCGKAVKWG